MSVLSEIHDVKCPGCGCLMSRINSGVTKEGTKRFDCEKCRIRVIIHDKDYKKKYTRWNK